ncbi:hypothetical protein [Bradyrhizobium iriomotense]|uniref:DUF3426 domain-containing protein n=1 Tax=Bradyrhizobium iriomotense TaxID=441950 RepID=A0ABQ6B8B8_9BRAD|nr:hypothetical protein [Bradyrhizobium iriomotense]GLR90652.1 hypothetical protein GCM10007857_73670 [Bradyrhizobium iriomotense]
MLAGLYRVDLNSLVKLGTLLRPAFSVKRRSPLWLAAVVLVGASAWGLMSASEGNESDGIELATVQPEPAQSVPPEAAATQASVPAELDRLHISSQSWRRGGLGSRALVTFTVRNDNDYAVKDVEILCAFARRDGSHLTDRRRVLAEAVSMKSRKTFAHVPIGFVNVNASQAKCSLAAARRV